MFRTCFYSMNQSVNPLCSRSASQLPKKLPNAYSLFVSENYKLFKSKLPPNTLSKEVSCSHCSKFSIAVSFAKREIFKRFSCLYWEDFSNELFYYIIAICFNSFCSQLQKQNCNIILQVCERFLGMLIRLSWGQHLSDKFH